MAPGSLCWPWIHGGMSLLPPGPCPALWKRSGLVVYGFDLALQLLLEWGCLGLSDLLPEAPKTYHAPQIGEM